MTLAELAAVFAEHGGLLLDRAAAEVHKGSVVLTMTMSLENRPGAVVEYELALKRAVDLATIRALSARYGIDTEKLEALLPQ